ncbi:hypothetical protein YPPY103_3124, partial [Yersinia pestis PY-103]
MPIIVSRREWEPLRQGRGGP